MIEWIQHWDEMRFFYWSPLNWLILLPVYLVGAALIALVCWLLAKLWKPAWFLAIPLLVVLAIAPIWEELDIAYNFGQLCKKDAGIFVYKTAEVEGFYNASAVLPKVYIPLAPESVDYYEKSGYRYYELGLAQAPGSQNKVVHIEKVNGVWTPTILDRPTSRYRFSKPHSHTDVAHKVTLFEYVVEDTSKNEVIAREKTYAREAPWFFVGLDRPTRFCAVSGDFGENIHSTLYDLVLKPAGRP